MDILLQVLHRIDLPINDEGRLEFFTSFPQDPVHKGSLQLRTGARIGLPSTFAYQTLDDVEHSLILVGDEKVDWSSTAGNELQNALVLSDKAKAFVIAREIYYTKSMTVQLNLILTTVCCGLAYITGSLLNDRFLLSLRLKPWARFSVFSTIASAWLLFFVVVDDALHCWYDNEVDRAAAKLREIYAQGGVDYYNAVLRRNRALRTLLGSAGQKQYTYYGNVVSVWRNPSVQLTSRHDNLLKYLAEYKKEVQPEDDETEPKTGA